MRPHIVGDVGVDVQRGGRRHMAQHGGECFRIHTVFQCQNCEGAAQIVEANAGQPRPQEQGFHVTISRVGIDGILRLYLYALNPSQYGDVKNVVWQGFRQPLDEYFNLLFTNPSAAQKPVQDMPNQVPEIIEHLGRSISPEKIHLAHSLMDLAPDAKEDLAGQIEYALRRQRELKHSVPLVVFGEIEYCAFISMPGIIQYPIQKQLDYACAAASRNEKIPVM